jgi:phospholipase C
LRRIASRWNGIARAWPNAIVCIAAAAAHAAPATPPHLDHIVVIILENRTYDQVRTLPTIASLIASGSVFTQSWAVSSPSLPNYLALWSGSTQGVSSNTCPPRAAPFTTENLGHACEAAGLTWRAYSENLPEAGSSVCTADASLYTRKHAPWTDFSNLDHANERPYSDLALDIATGSLPNLAFVVPNNCNNSHDCSALRSDSWLASQVPALLAALGPNDVLVLTYDEGDGNVDDHILTLLVGAPVRAGYEVAERIDHYGILRLLCDGLGLAPFGAAADQPPILEVWANSTATQATTWARVKTIYR